MDSYLVPAGYGEAELTEKRSRFIGQVWRVETEAEARVHLEEVRKKYHDARHHCWCYVLREGNVLRYGDDGEPQGTAGQPMLNVFLKEEVSNAVCVVTRYFGGIKLGAGGLIRAYSSSVSEAAEAIGIVKRVKQQELIFSIPYNRYDKVDHFLKEKEVFVAGTEYGVNITISIYLDLDQIDPFISDLTELLNGEPDLIKGDQRYNEIPVKSGEKRF